MKHKALQFARRVWTRDSNLWLLKEQHQVCLRGPALAPAPCLPCLPRARSARHTLRLESRSARRLPTCLCICSVPCLGEETEPDPIKALGPVEIRPLMVLGDPPLLRLEGWVFPGWLCGPEIWFCAGTRASLRPAAFSPQKQAEYPLLGASCPMEGSHLVSFS